MRVTKAKPGHATPLKRVKKTVPAERCGVRTEAKVDKYPSAYNEPVDECREQLGFTQLEVRTELSLREKARSLNSFAGPHYSPHLNQGLASFIETHKTSHKIPRPHAFSEDISAGKNTYVYDAHTYHTKVPPEAIKRMIEHYSGPGDLVLDPFCGSGMTGVAALQAGRKPILSDLSPAATFISLNFLTPVNAHKYVQAINLISAHMNDEELLLYGTHCRTCGKPVPMEYMVWSYGLLCRHCRREFVLWDVARDERESVRESKIKKEFDCPHCGKRLMKRALERTRLYPVQIGYRCCASGLTESKAVPNEYDLALLQAAGRTRFGRQLWYPTARFPDGVNTKQAINHGLDTIDKIYTDRNLRAIARLWDIARRWPDKEISLKLMFTITSLYQRVTKLSEFRFWGGSGNMANYNVPMIFNEQNVFKVFRRKAKTIRDYLETWRENGTKAFCIATQSATKLSAISDDTIDYIFTDPPFGANINYSEMNYLWEAWLNVFTDSTNEAIVNRVLGKNIETYGALMTQALQEMHRVLKPGRWLTLVFHNSSSVVWSALQQAINDSGFTVVRTLALDKKHGTFKQFVSENAVGYDLMLQCQKHPRNVKAPHVLRRHARSDATLHSFLSRTLAHDPGRFIVHYLHVNRKDELDYRKLYSLWLKERVESNERIGLGFDEFRKAVASALESNARLKRAFREE